MIGGWVPWSVQDHRADISYSSFLSFTTQVQDASPREQRDSGGGARGLGSEAAEAWLLTVQACTPLGLPARYIALHAILLIFSHLMCAKSALSVCRTLAP